MARCIRVSGGKIQRWTRDHQNVGSASESLPPTRSGGDLLGQTRAVADLDGDAAERGFAHGGGKASRGDAAQEAADRLVLLHAEHAVVVAGHAGVGEVGGAAGENLMVGGRHVGVGADDEARPAVEVVGHALLLGSRLGVDVDQHGIRLFAERAGGKFAVDGGERIVQRIHEDAAHDVGHQHAGAVAGDEEVRSPAGCSRREVGGADQLRLPLDEDQRLALVPDVVARGDRVGAGVDEVLADLLGDAEAARGILAVHHHEIEAIVGNQPRQAFGDGRPPGPAHHVAHEQEPHRRLVFVSTVEDADASRRRKSGVRNCIRALQIPERNTIVLFRRTLVSGVPDHNAPFGHDDGKRYVVRFHRNLFHFLHRKSDPDQARRVSALAIAGYGGVVEALP